MSLNIVCEQPDCQRAMKVNEQLAGKRIKCPGCGHVMVVPQPEGQVAAAAGQRQTVQRKRIVSRSAPPRPRRRWPLLMLLLLGLAAAGAGLAYHFKWGPFEADGLWSRVVAAKLTLVVAEKCLTTKDLKFPQRDYAADFKNNLKDSFKALSNVPPEWERARLLGEVETAKKDGGLQATIYLFSSRESNWPRDGRSLNLEIWGSRNGPAFLYDLKLDGRQQEDGSFKGQATGRLQIASKGWLTFEDAEFRLQPWTITNAKPEPMPKPQDPKKTDSAPESKPKPEQVPETTPVVKPEPKSEPKTKTTPVASAVKQHVKSLRVVLPGASFDLDGLVKRIHAIYEPHGVKVVIGNVTDTAPLKEDAILAVTYDRRRGIGESLDHDLAYVWIDVTQQFVATANTIRESTFGAFSTPLGFAEKFKTSFVPPLFIRDVRACLSTHEVADADSGIFAFGKAVATDDGAFLLYAKTISLPSEQDKKLGKKGQWELRVIDARHNKVVARQPCQGEELFLHGSSLYCHDDRFGGSGLEVRDLAKLPELGAPTQLFAGKNVTKVAAAGRFLCVIVDERLHILSLEKGSPPRELSVDNAPTAALSLWTSPAGRVWTREAVPKDAKRIGALRMGRIDGNGKFQLEVKASFADMDEGDAIAAGLGARYALGDKLAASIAPYHHQSALRLYDLTTGKPKLLHKLDGVAGKDIVLYEDLCAVLDDSALRLFSIADPKNVQRFCDVPLGRKMSSKGVPIKDLSQLSFFLLGVQGGSSQMRLVNDHIVAHSHGIVSGKQTGKLNLSSVAQVHRIALTPFRGGIASKK